MIKLRPFQVEGVRMIYQFRGRVILADEMGLGKTIQALYWIQKIPSRRPVVIVTPASVKYVWQAEAQLHFGIRAEVLEGRRPKRQMNLPGEIVILNYDILASWLPVLVKADPQVVILDECHYCKNIDAKRTKAVRTLAFPAASVLALSGTPMTQRPIELWPILSIVRPDIFPDRLKYAWRYCRPRHTIWGWKFDGAARTKELNQILRKECMIRRLKEEVAPELPAKIHKAVPFRLKSYDEYNQAVTDFLKWLKLISPAKAKRARRNQALVKVGYLLRLTARLKMEWTIKWLEEFAVSNPDKKIVCLTMHTFVIDELRKKFPDSVVVDGRVTGMRRVEAIRKFQSNKRTRYMFANWKAAGIGITLTAAHILAALDLPWTAGDLQQGSDRVHRIGQKYQVFIFYLLVLDTIEQKLMNVLKKNAKVLESVLNGERTSRGFDLFEALLDEIKK